MAEQACSETTWDGWHSHPCRRPVKRNGMCGPHAAGKDRSAKAEADRKAKYAETKRRDQERRDQRQTLLDIETTVARVEALANEWERHGIGISLTRLMELRAALTGGEGPVQRVGRVESDG